MALVVEGFQWDSGNWPKCARHGVSKAEIEAVFGNRPGVLVDQTGIRDEKRLNAVGRTVMGRHVFVVFTVRSDIAGRLIRPISARYMHAKEIKHYDDQTGS